MFFRSVLHIQVQEDTFSGLDACPKEIQAFETDLLGKLPVL